MKIKTFLLVIASSLAAVTPATSQAQEIALGLMDRVAASAGFSADHQKYGVAQAGYADPCHAEDFYCNNGRCGDCVGCCRQYDIWGSAELLVWWAKGTPIPPLVTTALPGTPALDAAALGQPNTRILFGDELTADEAQVGIRLAAGIWLDSDHNTAVGGRLFVLGGDTTSFSAGSDNGDPILARPFFNAVLGIQDALLINYPNIAFGNVRASVEQENTVGFEAFVEFMMSRDCCRRIDFLVGYQFLRLDDRLEVVSNSTVDDGGVFDGTVFGVTDRFSTQNEFNGGEAGIKARLARGCWSIDALGKIGIGNMSQRVTIFGETVITTPAGATTSNPSGILVQATNSGTFERNQFTYIPELTLNLKYHATRNVSFHLGYNLMWLPDVVLSGEQIDFTVNPAPQLAGPARPAFAFNDTDYWLQGVNFGMNFDY